MQIITRHYHHFRSRALGMLVLRLAVGAIFIYAGYFKLTNMDMVISGFASMGIGAVLAWIVAILEFVGGISIVVGFWTRFFVPALTVILIVAMAMTKMIGFGDPSGQMHWLLLAGLIAIFFNGCGKWSLCAWKHHRDCMNCKTDGKCECEHK